MQELILKMVLCLVIALAIGFLFGWFLKRAFTKKQYGTRIDALQADLAESKTKDKMKEEELSLLKEQLLTTQESLETSSHKSNQLEEHLRTYQAKLSMQESNIQDRESIIQKEQEEKNLLRTQVDEKHQELEKILIQSANQNEVINRVKEHHALLKAEVTKLTTEKTQELDKLSIMIASLKENEKKLQDEKKVQEHKIKELQNSAKEIDKLHTIIASYKEKEAKILDEKKAKESKLLELESVLNEKKIAAIELRSKVKEMDILKQKNGELNAQLKEAQEQATTYKNKIVALQNSQEDFINQPVHTSKEKKTERFDFMKFAKKALHYVPDTNEEINKNADKVIKEYKNRQSK